VSRPSTPTTGNQTTTTSWTPPSPLIPDSYVYVSRDFDLISDFYTGPTKQYKKKTCGDFEYFHTLYFRPLAHDHPMRIRLNSLKNDTNNNPSIPDITLSDFVVVDDETNPPAMVRIESIKNKKLKEYKAKYLRRLVVRFEGCSRDCSRDLNKEELVNELLQIYLDAPDIILMCKYSDEREAERKCTG
jgi:hypothetical protein